MALYDEITAKDNIIAVFKFETDIDLHSYLCLCEKETSKLKLYIYSKTIIEEKLFTLLTKDRQKILNIWEISQKYSKGTYCFINKNNSKYNLFLIPTYPNFIHKFYD